MLDHKVSILIPVYNREHLVRRAIESALQQTYADIEVVVVDNCSTDNTYSVIQEYARCDSRVRVYLSNGKVGPVENWYDCIRFSQGEYGKILFSDDWMEPDAIHHLLQPFKDNSDVAFAYSSVYGHRAGETPKVWYGRTREGLISTEDFLWEFASGGTVPVSPCAALFRLKDLLSAITLRIPNRLGYDCDQYGIGNDALLYWRACERYPYVYHVREPLIHFDAAQVDEPGFSYSLTEAGKGDMLRTCYLASFAYFLATSSLPEKSKRLLHTALFVSHFFSFHPSPARYMCSTREYSSLFPEGYHCKQFEFLYPRILVLMGKQFRARLEARLKPFSREKHV